MKLIRNGLIAGLVFEIITLFVRFSFDLQSTRDTAFIGQFTAGIRIHHGYIGALLIFLYLLKIKSLSSQIMATKFTTGEWLYMLGIGLLTSDLAHHFLALWIITGSPQFDLLYPQS